MAFIRPGGPSRPPAVDLDAAPPLHDLWEEFIDASASIINAETDSIYRYSWSRFMAWLAKEGLPARLASVTKPILVMYIADLASRPKEKGSGKLSRHSVQHYVRPIRTFLRWCVSEGYYPDDPFAGPRGIMPHLGPRILKTALTADLEMLLVGCDERTAGKNWMYAVRDRMIVLLGADTGLRTGEVCFLDVGNINLEGGYIVIRESKWDGQRIMPISPEVAAAIRRYLRRARPAISGRTADSVAPDEPFAVGRYGVRLTENALYQAVSRTYKRGGGKMRFGLHRLRHFFGTEVQRRGMSIGVAKQLMGHEDIKTTSAYQHVTVADAREAHARATPLNSLPASRRRRLA